MSDEKDIRKIAEAITNSQYRWRTPEGIAKETGLSLALVVEALDTDGQFIRSRKSNEKGRPLYTTRQKRNTKRTLSMRFISALTNKIAE